jgi:hypothetical protein
MKITLNIPDLAEDKHLYFMAGIKLATFKYLNQPRVDVRIK